MHTLMRHSERSEAQSRNLPSDGRRKIPPLPQACKPLVVGRDDYGSQGQTFLEVIIALALIVLFLSGVAVVELYSIRNVEYSQSKSLASKLARQQLERARVVRDSAGIDALIICLSTCYINSALTPVPLTPTGVFGQSLIMENASQTDCPVPTATAGQPNPVYYKAKSVISWSRQAGVTPAPGVEMSTCITDWR